MNEHVVAIFVNGRQMSTGDTLSEACDRIDMDSLPKTPFWLRIVETCPSLQVDSMPGETRHYQDRAAVNICSDDLVELWSEQTVKVCPHGHGAVS